MNQKKCKSVLLTALFIVILSAFSAVAQERTYEPVTFHEVFKGLYEIRGGAGANCGVFIGASEVLLIDMKMDRKSVDEVLSGVSELTNKPIRYLISTHSDRDHVGGNLYIPADAAIISHENCRKEMFLPDRDGNPSAWSDPAMAPFLPSVTFTEKMILHLADTVVELWHFGPGHTTGDIVVYFPDAKTAFVGDQVRFGRPQLIHSYKGGNSFGHVANLTRMLESLKDAERFCSGHNDPATRADVLRHIEQMKNRQIKVRTLMDDGKTLKEILGMFTEEESRLVTSIYSELENFVIENTKRSMDEKKQ